MLRSIAEKDKLISTLRTRIDLLMIENEKALKESAGVERLHDQIQKLQAEKETCNLYYAGPCKNFVSGEGVFLKFLSNTFVEPRFQSFLFSRVFLKFKRLYHQKFKILFC